MRPGQAAPDEVQTEFWLLSEDDASMRPGQAAPDEAHEPLRPIKSLAMLQ